MVHVRMKYEGAVIYEKMMKAEAVPRLGEAVTVPGSQRQYTVQFIHKRYTRTGILPIKLVVIELSRESK